VRQHATQTNCLCRQSAVAVARSEVFMGLGMKLIEKATIIHYHRHRLGQYRAGTVESLLIATAVDNFCMDSSALRGPTTGIAPPAGRWRPASTIASRQRARNLSEWWAT
jgi:hypothetical protein